MRRPHDSPSPWNLRLLMLVGSLAACRPDSATGPEPVPVAAIPGSVAEASSPPRARCPTDMAEVQAVEDGSSRVLPFCIDRYEGSLMEGGGRPHDPYALLRNDRTYVAQSRPGVPPQGYLSQLDASRACAKAGKRLCRAREWLLACRGRAQNLYPYGNAHEEGRCNTGKPHLPRRLFGPGVKLTFENHYNSPRLNRTPGFLARTGEFARCVTASGVHDLVGNLHEWVADQVGPALKREIPLPYGDHLLGPRGNGVFMGGYFSSKDEHGTGCRYVTTSHAPGYHDYSTGFRCCADLAAVP